MRNKLSARDRAFQYKKEGFYCTDNSTVMCKFCNTKVSWDRKDTIEKHLKSAKHVASLAATKEETTKLQTSVASCFNKVVKDKKSADYLGKRVTETFVKANIPLEKLNNEHMVNFMNEFIEGSGALPCVKTLREKHLPRLNMEREENIKEKVKGKHLAVCCDETTDKQGRCVFVIIFKIIEASHQVEIVVGDVHILETADAKSCSRAILDSLNKYNISYDSVLALVSDSARYMGKCFDTLTNLMSDNVVVIQCWAHKLNLILNVLGKHLPELQNATSKIKSAFLNTRKRKHLFRQFLDDKYEAGRVPLFPMPVLTRWSSWYESVAYVSDYIEAIVEFMKSDDIASVSNVGVQYLASLSQEQVLNVKVQAAFIKETAKGIVDLTKLLEGSSYPCSNILCGNLRKVEQVLQLAEAGNFGEETSLALQSCGRDVAKAQVKSALVKAASHGYTKLLALISSDPASHLYSELSVFDPAQILITEVTKDLGKKLKKMALFKDCDESQLLQGYKELQFLVKKQLGDKSDASLDLIAILLSLSVNHPEFSKGALKSVWLPCANADCERFFSKYSSVLSDQRQRLNAENVAILSEIYFEG
ncbi:uncharacterized protein LOC134542793 [Bacillus rossius redtenbacheri]|uniref:uncharacterized protein LOC134527751 n=1 Tax=Bacillus rossius redtenbacheri TaxID=93214 RepID=UPI002FDD80E8